MLLILCLLPCPASAEEHKHSVSKWTVTEAPTCTGSGARYGVCDICGKKVYRVIEATGHSFGAWAQKSGDVRARTCESCGATELEYAFETERATDLCVRTPGTEQQLGLRFPAGYTGALTLSVPAGEETELLLRVPGGILERVPVPEGGTDFALTLPDRSENRSVQLRLPARTEPLHLTVSVPEGAQDSLTVYLPALGAAAELNVPFPERSRLYVTVTGNDATKTRVSKAEPEISARLIGSDVIEIDYPDPVFSDEEAKALFSVSVGGVPAEWEYLSYFDFGPYAQRGGVLSIRLSKALDAGQPAMYVGDVCIARSTQEENGTAAAAGVLVSYREQTVEASFVPFWSELRYVAETGATVWVAAGAETAQMPPEEAGLTVHLLGADRSVYEDPYCRGRYRCGKTYDTYVRASFPGDGSTPAILKSV